VHVTYYLSNCIINTKQGHSAARSNQGKKNLNEPWEQKHNADDSSGINQKGKRQKEKNEIRNCSTGQKLMHGLQCY